MSSYNNEPVDAPLPGTRPSPTFTPSLAGSQPWVILMLKAALVDLILAYEDRLEELGALEERQSSLERENQALRLERARCISLAQAFVESIGAAAKLQPELPSEPSPSQVHGLADRRTGPLASAMDFLEKYCDPADVYDVRYGPIGKRREVLYHEVEPN